MKKKLVSFALAATMVLSMATTVFAADTAAVTGTQETEDSFVNEQAVGANEEEALLEANDEGAIGYIDLSTISMSTRNVNPGGTVVITFKTANVKRLHFYYDYYTTDGSYHSFQTTSYDNPEKGNAEYDEATGTWTLTVIIPTDAATGVWELSDIQLIDVNGKYSYVMNAEMFPKSENAADLSAYSISVGGAALPSGTSGGASAGTSSTGRSVPHYDIREVGGTWDGSHYTLNGEVVKDVFFCDGTYTYYLQADGTPMTDRLTYHPDGQHVIYFDANGHEVFSNFANVKKSIAGDPVDDFCFFDVYGYMYVNVLTYDQAGVNLYYANPYGVMERNGWFTFADGTNALGYANADATLAVNIDTYDPYGNLVHIGGNGHVQ